MRHRQWMTTVVFMFFWLIAQPAWAAPTYETALKTADGPVELHIVRHASFVLRWNDRVIYVDPVGDASYYRGLPAPDVVLLTHPHHDHLDTGTLAALDTRRAIFVMPRSVADKIGSRLGRRRIVLANGQRTDRVADGLKAVAMYNLPKTPDAYHPKGWGNGYVLTLGGQRIYISGDTEDTPEMRGLKNIDLAFVCMNLPYTMNTEQAANAVLDFAPRIIYPYHYRGQNVADFKQRVNAGNPAIEVRLREWYPNIEAELSP